MGEGRGRLETGVLQCFRVPPRGHGDCFPYPAFPPLPFREGESERGDRLDSPPVKASCVIKVGGSLLDYPELPPRLTSYLADLGRPNPVLVCGGGPTVDAIRRIDRAHGMDEAASHWIAVRAMTLNARMLEAIVPNLIYIERARDLPRAWKSRKIPLLDPFIFLSEVDESSGDPLPRRWRVTSDSIAARMAARLEAPELVLLKSAEVPEQLTVSDAAEEGIVDAQFPLATRELDRIILVSFRGEEIRETLLEKECPGSSSSLDPPHR